MIAALRQFDPRVMAPRLWIIFSHQLLDGDHPVTYTLARHRMRVVCGGCGVDRWL